MVFPLIFFIFSLFLNGATDAVNSVAGAIGSKALSKWAAMPVSAAFQALGTLIFCALFPSLSLFMKDTADFSESQSIAVFTISLLTVVLWAGAAWLLSLPTSEGHALIAALFGCGLAMGHSPSAKSVLFVFIGIAASLGGSIFLTLIFFPILKKVKARSPVLRRFSIFSMCLSSFIHGAQDGQKFIGLAIAAKLFASNKAPILLTVLLMGLGTLCGGGRIVKKVSEEATHTSLYSSCIADISGGASLLILTALGIPASTTHAKITALCTAGYLDCKKLDKKVIASLLLAWVLTFPACFILAFFMVKLAFLLGFCL